MIWFKSNVFYHFRKIERKFVEFNCSFIFAKSLVYGDALGEGDNMRSSEGRYGSPLSLPHSGRKKCWDKTCFG